MPELKITPEVRKHWRNCCKDDSQEDSGISRRGINRILDDVEELETRHVRFMVQGGPVVMASEYDLLKAERDALLLWITENLTVDQVQAATSFVVSRR